MGSAGMSEAEPQVTRPARLWRAALIAPLTTVPALLLFVLILNRDDTRTLARTWDEARFALMWFSVFGLPIAYSVAAILLYGAHFFGAAPSRVPPRPILVVGTLAGAVVGAVPWVIGGAMSDWPIPLVGAWLGAIVSLTFLLVRDGAAGATFPARTDLTTTP